MRNRRRLWTALCVAGAALILLGALFDWNWFRAPLERFIAERSQREVRIGDLHVDVGADVAIRARRLYVSNWSDSGPLIDAGEAVFVVSLNTLFAEKRVLPRIVLRDAQVNMEWREDGRRNWRLLNPDYTGPGRFKVLRLDAVRSSLRFINRGSDLDLQTAANEPDAAHVSRVDFKGRFRGREFDGSATTAMPLSLRETGEAVPLRGYLRADRTRIDIDGQVADLWQPSMIDAAVQFAGPNLAQLRPFLPMALSHSRPYHLEGRVSQSDTETTSVSVHGKVGATELSADTSYSRQNPRPKLRASVRLVDASLADFLAPATGREGQLFSAERMPRERLRAADAKLSIEAKHLVAAQVALEDFRLAAVLENGSLRIGTVAFGVGGGHVTAAGSVADSEDAIAAALSAEVRHVRLERMPWLAGKARVSGPVDGTLKLAGRGESLAALMGSAAGHLEARMPEGRLSALADAKMALDGGRVVALKIFGDRELRILDAAAYVEFRNGIGRVRKLSLDTERNRLEGTGSLDLRTEQIDLLLKPQPKDPSPFTFSGELGIRGPLLHPAVSMKRSG